jgi:hypothetical protein
MFNRKTLHKRPMVLGGNIVNVYHARDTNGRVRPVHLHGGKLVPLTHSSHIAPAATEATKQARKKIFMNLEL